MDKQNEFIAMVRIIEEVSRHGRKCPKTQYCKIICGKDGELFSCADCKIATALINAGYGDVKAAVRAFAESLKEKRTSIIICTGTGEVTATGDIIHDEDIDELLKEYEG